MGNNAHNSKIGDAASKFGKFRVCLLIVTLVLIPNASFFSSDSARAAGDIVLGVATSLAYIEGQDSLRAVQLAVDEINAGGGVRVGGDGRPFRIEAIDLGGASPAVPASLALERLETLITEKKVHAMAVGPFRSEILLAGMDIFARHKVPVLGALAMSTASGAKILKDPRYKYIFRVCLDSKYLVDYLIDTMKFFRDRYGFDKVYIMNQDVAWTRTTASLMVKLYFDRSDWRIVGIDHYPTAASDFSEGLLNARNRGAQVIIPLFDMPESGQLVEQWHKSKNPALLCGFISPMVGPGAWRVFGGKIAGSLNIIFELGNIPSNRWEPAKVFHSAYQAKFGRDIEAGHGPAPAYESVYILKGAIERAGCLDPDRIVTALESTDRIGVMGRIRFHRGHQAIFGDDPNQDALACIVQWKKDGQRKIVYPLSIAESEIELPSHYP